MYLLLRRPPVYVPQIARNLQLSQSLSPEQVSQAWEFLVSLPPDHPQIHLALPDPPENLRHLSAADWLLLDNLLARELNLKEHSPVH
jgi:hypothetical protein